MRKSRTGYFDVLRVFSMCAVVYLHVAAPALRQSANMRLWHVSNLLTALATVAVPIFFMISGALLIGSEKTADVRYLLTHRLPHILIPFLLWSLIEVGAAYFYTGADTARAMLSMITSKPVIVPYWFLYAILPLYLLSPLLKRMVDGLSPKLFRYLLGLWLVFSILLKTITDYLPDSIRPYIAEHPVYHLSLLGGFLGYFLLGAYLNGLSRPLSKKWLSAVLIADTLLITLGTWYSTQCAGQYSEQFKSYLSLYVVILGVCMFLLAKEVFANKTLPAKPLALLSGASFFVYLAHPRAIDLIRRIFTPVGEPLLTLGTIVQQLGFYLLVLGATVLACLILASVRPLCFPLTGQRYKTAANLQALAKQDATSK